MEPDITVKDHSVIIKDGFFHIFYIRDKQKNFGYASSPDLIHWTIHEPVLEPGPGSWDSNDIWAPHAIDYPYGPGYLLMYYTGVNINHAQRTCLAMTRIPSIWHKASPALFVPFHGDSSWIAWNENEQSHYRDPCFFLEDGVCFLLHTAQTKNRFYGVVALAESDDYFSWNDTGPLYVHNNWHLLESCFLMKRNGKYHLFFTEEGVGGVSHMSSDSLRSGWDIIKRILIDSGHAAEITHTGSDSYIFSRHSLYSTPSVGKVSSIRFDALSWIGDRPEVNMTSYIGENWTILWGTAFDNQPIFGNNPHYRGDDTTEVGFEGNWWIGTYESFNGPLTGTYPGSFQGDGPRGAIRSRTFTIRGQQMRLLVGGGYCPDSCYVALCKAGNGKIIYRETGNGTDLMDERTWDLTPYRNRDVYIMIVDNSSGAFGHINVDGIEERLVPTNPSPDEGEVGPAPEKGRKPKLLASYPGTENHTQPIIPTIYNLPNPFNPETEIHFRGSPNTPLTVVIYSSSGAEVNRLVKNTDDTGLGHVHWDGRNLLGKKVSAGVYMAALKNGQKVLAVGKLVLVR